MSEYPQVAIQGVEVLESLAIFKVIVESIFSWMPVKRVDLHYYGHPCHEAAKARN